MGPILKKIVKFPWLSVIMLRNPLTSHRPTNPNLLFVVASVQKLLVTLLQRIYFGDTGAAGFHAFLFQCRESCESCFVKKCAIKNRLFLDLNITDTIIQLYPVFGADFWPNGYKIEPV